MRTCIDRKMDVMVALISSPSAIKPFFRASVPLIPPGINASYAPAINRRTGKPILVHTKEAKDFLSKVSWYFRDRSCTELDQDLFNRISASRLHVPMSLSLTVYYTTMWKSDSDGPLKIVKDGLFEHFKFIAPPGQGKSWNDNRVIDDHIFKRVDALNPHFELEICCTPLPAKVA